MEFYRVFFKPLYDDTEVLGHVRVGEDKNGISAKQLANVIKNSGVEFTNNDTIYIERVED